MFVCLFVFVFIIITIVGVSFKDISIFASLLVMCCLCYHSDMMIETGLVTEIKPTIVMKTESRTVSPVLTPNRLQTSPTENKELPPTPPTPPTPSPPTPHRQNSAPFLVPPVDVATGYNKLVLAGGQQTPPRLSPKGLYSKLQLQPDLGGVPSSASAQLPPQLPPRPPRSNPELPLSNADHSLSQNVAGREHLYFQLEEPGVLLASQPCQTSPPPNPEHQVAGENPSAGEHLYHVLETSGKLTSSLPPGGPVTRHTSGNDHLPTGGSAQTRLVLPSHDYDYAEVEGSIEPKAHVTHHSSDNGRLQSGGSGQPKRVSPSHEPDDYDEVYDKLSTRQTKLPPHLSHSQHVTLAVSSIPQHDSTDYENVEDKLPSLTGRREVSCPGVAAVPTILQHDSRDYENVEDELPSPTGRREVTCPGVAAEYEVPVSRAGSKNEQPMPLHDPDDYAEVDDEEDEEERHTGHDRHGSELPPRGMQPTTVQGILYPAHDSHDYDEVPKEEEEEERNVGLVRRHSSRKVKVTILHNDRIKVTASPMRPSITTPHYSSLSQAATKSQEDEEQSFITVLNEPPSFLATEYNRLNFSH